MRLEADLQKDGHLAVVHCLDGVLQELGGVLQMLTVPRPETRDVVQFFLLLGDNAGI